MFVSSLISAAALALAVSASPIQHAPRTSHNIGAPTSLSHVSFNNWGNFENLGHFDEWFGVDNFGGSFNHRNVLEENLVCRTVEIDVIQQQLAIVQEFAKRIVVQQICEVEVQTIVWGQFVSGFDAFGEDIRRISGRNIGFDRNIAGHIGNIVDGNGNINHDFGFRGADIGSNFVHVSGDNWIDGQSEVSVGNAFLASQISSLQSSSFGRFGRGGNFGGVVSVGGF